MYNIRIIACSLLFAGIALVLAYVYFHEPEQTPSLKIETVKKNEKPIAHLPSRSGPAEILFGCSISKTGRYHKEGQRVIEGYNLIFERIDAEGGLKVGDQRYPTRIIYYDDASDAENVRSNIKRLITEDRVDFLLGPFSSTLTLAASEIAEEYGVILVEACGASEVIFSRGARCTFGVMTTASWYLRDFFKMISQQVDTRLTYGVMAMDKLFSRSVAKGARIWGNKFGFEEAYYEVLDINRDNWAIYMEELKRKAPEIIIFTGHYLDSVNFALHLSSLSGYHPKAVVLTLGPTQREFISQLGSKVEYMIGISQWSSQAGYGGPFFKSSAEYARIFEARYGVKPTYQNAQASTACLVYQMALEKCGTLNSQRVLETIRALDTETFYGKIRFNSRGINIGHEMVIIQIQNGHRKLVWSEGPTVNEFIYPIPERGN